MDIKLGSTVKGEVIDFTHEGKGVIKVDNFTVFVEGGLIGDKVEVKINEMKKSFAIGSVTEIIEPSKDRIKLDFPLEESMGGIPLIEYKYSKQLEWKRSKVKSDLERIGKIKNVKVNETIGMENPYRYRNHVQIPVGTKDYKTIVGFYELSSRDIVDMRESILMPEIGNKILKIIRDWIDQYNIKAYDKKTKDGVLRHIGIRINKDNEAMIILVTGSKRLPEKDELINLLIGELVEVKSIFHNVNRMNSPIVYGDEYYKVYGEKKLVDSIGDYKFNISPNSFFQVNRTQSKVLYDIGTKYLDPNKEDVLFDLYSGIGTIPIYIADKVKYIYGIESVSEAVKDANENKELNDVDNVEIIQGRSEIILDRLVDQIPEGNKIILDPPRGGCEEEVLEAIIKMSPEKIVYISCNSTTLARDAKYLVSNGYKIIEVQPVDMFPHTMHVECIALIQRKTI